MGKVDPFLYAAIDTGIHIIHANVRMKLHIPPDAVSPFGKGFLRGSVPHKAHMGMALLLQPEYAVPVGRLDMDQTRHIKSGIDKYHWLSDSFQLDHAIRRDFGGESDQPIAA